MKNFNLNQKINDYKLSFLFLYLSYININVIDYY